MVSSENNLWIQENLLAQFIELEEVEKERGSLPNLLLLKLNLPVLLQK